MWIEHVLLGLFGLAAGAAVSAGTFAFLLMLKIIPRMLGRSHTASKVMLYENMIIIGGVLGNIISVCLGIRLPFYGSGGLVAGHVLLGIYGIIAGFFVGCIAVALAEILQTFPILFRRLKMKEGLWILIFAMALGKCVGAFVFFFCNLTAG